MKYRAVIEDAIGETRAAVYEGRRLVELHLTRDSHAHLPQAGDIYAARIKSLEPSLNGAFVDLGQNQSGFLTFTNNRNMPRLTEGQGLKVSVSKAPKDDKQATVKFIEILEKTSPERLKQTKLTDRLQARFPGIKFDTASVSAIDNAVESTTALQGGGSVTFDQTQALLAIDVDKGQGVTAIDVSLKAAEYIAQQLRLRGLGGLIVIDFPNLRQAKHRNQLFKAVERAFENDPAIVKIAPLSRFGCIELTRSMDYPSLDSLINDRYGRPTPETQALRAIRQLEREALSNKGAQFELNVSSEIYNWLEKKHINWEEAVNERIGLRYKVTEKAGIDSFTLQADR